MALPDGTVLVYNPCSSKSRLIEWWLYRGFTRNDLDFLGCLPQRAGHSLRPKLSLLVLLPEQSELGQKIRDEMFDLLLSIVCNILRRSEGSRLKQGPIKKP